MGFTISLEAPLLTCFFIMLFINFLMIFFGLTTVSSIAKGVPSKKVSNPFATPCVSVVSYLLSQKHSHIL